MWAGSDAAVGQRAEWAPGAAGVVGDGLRKPGRQTTILNWFTAELSRFNGLPRGLYVESLVEVIGSSRKSASHQLLLGWQHTPNLNATDEKTSIDEGLCLQEWNLRHHNI